MSGELALPRQNGELVFSAPWEGRAFGIAITLKDSGAFAWEEFREHLIAEVSQEVYREVYREQASVYYEQWLAALEKLVTEAGYLTPEELNLRMEEYATE